MWKFIHIKIPAFLCAAVVAVSCGINLMPSKDVWHTQHYWIMQDFEREAYREIPKAARPQFQAIFWGVETRNKETVFGVTDMLRYRQRLQELSKAQ